MDVGVIGLGNMGSAIVRSLLRAGHAVVVYNRTRAKAEALRPLGATVASELCDACRGDAAITLLSDDAAVEQVVCGDHGVLACLPPAKTVHVSMSTISPALVQRLAERHAERNQNFLSVPVLGRPDAAEQGKLSALAGGSQDLIDWLMPVFAAIALKTFTIGPRPESANFVKLACNTMIATMIESLGEVLAMITKSGLIEPKTLIDVLLATVLSSPTYRPYAEHALTNDFTPGFKVPLALKDIDLTLAAAKDISVPMPLVGLVREQLIEAIAVGYGDLDWSVLARVAQRDAGLPTTSSAP